MPNRIYRGPVDRQPRTVSDKTVAGAYLPGTFATDGTGQAQTETATPPAPDGARGWDGVAFDVS